MSSTYRDDRDAALARADALLRENEHLRGEVAALRAGVDPACDEGSRLTRSRLVHYSGAAASAVLLLGAMAGAAFVAHDTREAVASAAAEGACASEVAEPAFSDEAARRVLPPVAASPPLPRAASREAVAVGEAVGLPVAPLLRACFAGLRGHVDVLAAVDARGHMRRVRVLSEGHGGAARAERRCVRRSLRAVTFPTTYATFTAYERDAALGLTVLPYARVASR